MVSSNAKPFFYVSFRGIRKSLFMLRIFFWWCIYGHRVRAAAFICIIAASVRFSRTSVSTSSPHFLCAFSSHGESKPDLMNTKGEGTNRLASITIWIIDDSFTIDATFWCRLRDRLLSIAAMSTATALRFYQSQYRVHVRARIHNELGTMLRVSLASCWRTLFYVARRYFLLMRGMLVATVYVEHEHADCVNGRFVSLSQEVKSMARAFAACAPATPACRRAFMTKQRI